MAAILRFSFETDCTWEIEWQKLDLSDGFWRMIVETASEYSFVYQMPPRDGDTGRWYFVPSALQMGWTNSPPYFCTVTEAVRTLFKRILALTRDSGVIVPHRHEDKCIRHALPRPETAGPIDTMIMGRVFVDDFMNGIAGVPGRLSIRAEQLWVSRAALHAIHAVFPPPDVINHVGGKDSVSEKKLNKGDAEFKPAEILLGFVPNGRSGTGRTVSLPVQKKDRYVAKVREMLSKPFVSVALHREVHGKLQHAATVMPCMRGFMTPLNRAVSLSAHTIGLSKSSALREALEAFVPMLENASNRPSHITELVGPDLPHYYGYVDFAACGLGGVWLPCTRWMDPIVWRVPCPHDIAVEVRKEDGSVNNNDGEAAAVFVGELMLDHLLDGETAGISTHLGSDNSSTVGWNTRMASRATHKAPERFLRWQAMRQRWNRRGPADVSHVAGTTNLFGDFPSRSYEEGFTNDSAFLTEFARRHPLPPQLGCWRLVQPPAEIVSAAFSVLRNNLDTSTHPGTRTGDGGLGLPTTLANTLFSLKCKDKPSIWNEATCSWPLLSPSGEVSTTMAATFQARRSRKRFAGAPGVWSATDLQTLDAQIRGNTISTNASPSS
jgi:hypothetical protein